MVTRRKTYPDIDTYIASFSEDVQAILQQLRVTIRKAAPNAEETIRYSMPTFRLHGNLVHFAAYKKHIGFYPAPSGIQAFQWELSTYKGAKGSVQFPIDKPLPLDLISKIVKFRVEENLKNAKKKLRLYNANGDPRGHNYSPIHPNADAEPNDDKSLNAGGAGGY